MATKPPYFPFYGQDWMTGTMALSPAERGVYLDCLWFQWASGGVPGDDLTRMARVMRCSVVEARKLWPAIASKFTKGDDGLYRNARLEGVRAERDAFVKRSSERGTKGAAARWAKDAPSITQALPNALLENDSSSSSSNKSETRARRGFADPQNFRVDPNAAAHIYPGDERVISVPAGWATKARREYGLTAEDIDAFAAWTSTWTQRHGFEDGGKRLPWLDARLSDWRGERSRPLDRASRPVSEILAEQDRWPS